MDKKEFCVIKNTAEVYNLYAAGASYWATITVGTCEGGGFVQIASSEFGSWYKSWLDLVDPLKEYLIAIDLPTAAAAFEPFHKRISAGFTFFWQVLWPVFIRQLKHEVAYCPECKLPYSADYKIIGDFPRPSDKDIKSPLFTALFDVVKKWKDIRIPAAYNGTLHGDGKHVKMLYDAVKAAIERLQSFANMSLPGSIQECSINDMYHEPVPGFAPGSTEAIAYEQRLNALKQEIGKLWADSPEGPIEKLMEYFIHKAARMCISKQAESMWFGYRYASDPNAPAIDEILNISGLIPSANIGTPMTIQYQTFPGSIV